MKLHLDRVLRLQHLTGVFDCSPVTLDAQSMPSAFARAPQAPEIVSM